MYRIGLMSEFGTTHQLEPIQINGRPEAMPTVGENEMVVFGYDVGTDEWLLICDDLEEMQLLYDVLSLSGKKITWYKGPSFIHEETDESDGELMLFSLPHSQFLTAQEELTARWYERVRYILARDRMIRRITANLKFEMPGQPINRNYQTVRPKPELITDKINNDSIARKEPDGR